VCVCVCVCDVTRSSCCIKEQKIKSNARQSCNSSRDDIINDNKRAALAGATGLSATYI
jgi:hypothetical protein